MTKELTQIQEILYDDLVSIDDPLQRSEFLDHTCHGNHELRARLEKLLSLRNRAEIFFSMVPEIEPVSFGDVAPSESIAEDENTEGLGTRIGRYRLVERIGEGGCGAVYIAEQIEPVRRRVALKIIRVGFDTEHVIKRFEQERQALALMDHPNIARVLDAGTTASGRPFFVMQLVEGLRITDFCEQNRLDLTARLKLYVLVCRAIQHAHQKGIIHCDIKPSNVMVNVTDGVAVPKVIDFGIARATEGEHPAMISAADYPLIGTPTYMSPEQIDGNGLDVDTRSDIYGLGALLYELLTSMPPRDFGQIKNPSTEEIRQRLRIEALVPPSVRLQTCPQAALEVIAAARKIPPAQLPRMLRGDLDAIIMKAMEFDRKRRYSTASELGDDISHFLNYEPIHARREAGGGYRFAKLVRRNKVVFAAGTIAAIALTAGFGTSTWLFFREARARQEQANLRDDAERARAVESALRRKAQAGENVAFAAVLINRGDVVKADKLLSEVAMEDVPASLESATTYRTVAEWLFREGRWEEASLRFSAVAQAISRVDESDAESISIHFVSAAAAVVNAKDMEHYQELRHMAAKRFSGTRDPIVADEVVKTCLITPAEPELLDRLEPLIEVIEENLPWDREDTESQLMEAWQTLSLTMAAYRKGDFPKTEIWARRCLAHPNPSGSRSAAARAILAMALLRSDRAEVGRAELEVARRAVDDYFREPLEIEIGWTDRGFWFDWLIARILLKEAEGLLQG